MSTPANKLTAAVMKHLHKYDVFCWRQNNMPVYDPNINGGYGGYRSHGGMRGVPDIIAIIDGQFVGIEIKAGRDKMSEHQILFKKRCERNGGKYITVRSVADLKRYLPL